MKSTYRNMFDLTGKTAIVTGGLGILGRRFCQGLAEFNANVAVVDLDGDKTAEFARELAEEFGIEAEGVSCDVSDPRSVSAMVQRVVERFGNVHILHNNAASKSSDHEAFFAPFENYSLEEWRKVMAVNIDGMFLVAQAVGGRMVLQGTGGSIIQTSSIYGILASDKRIYEGSFYLGRQISNPGVYAASKAAVVGLTKYLAAYWADKGIRVNTLVPAGVESGQNETFKERYAARVPLGRMAQGEEMVGALIYLASDASSYVTGQNIVVDGGLSVW
ncbi:SDR family oxidoreductase [Oryzomonas sagensis]|uniref:SDR family oxidoreductase n=1 Tax=Oryzomonas sagensis TaxID=2603857 RepID=A0ABQ6TKC8_9BACT|nr:SDR family oxidoreductase [Oryzomonas sagensis]KAB0668524.1 SDR family oxidoreductase [Oryzomonas sagensis]